MPSVLRVAFEHRLAHRAQGEACVPLQPVQMPFETGAASPSPPSIPLAIPTSARICRMFSTAMLVALDRSVGRHVPECEGGLEASRTGMDSWWRIEPWLFEHQPLDSLAVGAGEADCSGLHIPGGGRKIARG